MSRCARSLPLAALVVALCLAPGAAGAAPPADRRPGRAVALRPGAQGLRRHRAQPTLEGLVHGRRRRAQRRLLPDQRHHQQRDAAVRRHRRLDVHRPADARHDLHGPGARRPRADLPRHRDGQERPLPDRHRLPDRPVAPDRAHALALRRAEGQADGLPASTSASTRRSTATAAAGTGNGGADTAARSRARGGHTLLVGSDPVTATNAANRDYAIPVYSRARRRPRLRPGRPTASPGSRQRRPQAARRARTRSPTLHDSADRRQPRPDRARRPRPRRRASRSRSASATPRPTPSSRRQRSLEHGFDDARRDYARGWHALRRQARQAAAPARRLVARTGATCSTSTTSAPTT